MTLTLDTRTWRAVADAMRRIAPSSHEHDEWVYSFVQFLERSIADAEHHGH